MLGTIGRIAIVLTSLAALAGCPRNIPQDASTGKDGSHKGAKPIALEGGEGRARDIVTYPGGDRVDWKVIQIPEGQQGDLRLKLSWKPPRPGLAVAMNVYDELFAPVGQIKPSRAGTSRGNTVTIKGASGKYYVQVYAPSRGDAGRYTVSVRFRGRKAVALPTLEELADQIADPPSLPAVVEPKPKTPEEIAAEEAEKAKQAEDERLRLEDEAKKAELRKPVYARVRQTQRSSSGGVIITITAGSKQQVDKTWVGTLLRGDTNQPLSGGEFTIIRVTERESVAKVGVSLDQVKANPRVELRRGPE